MLAITGWLNVALLFAEILPLVLAYEYNHNRSSIIVNTTSGPVRGTYINRHIKAFLGIPYAQLPVGELRFEPPKPIAAPSDTIIEATDFGYSCIQNIYGSPVQVPINKKGESEDCLTVNVFTSQKLAQNKTRRGLRPVLVWVYGGGWSEGYSSGESVRFIILLLYVKPRP